MTFTDYKDLGIPEVADNQSVFDFLEAISTVSPEFSNVWTVNLQTTATIGIGPAIPTLYKIVKVYRNYRRQSMAHKSAKAMQAAFPATLQGQPLDENGYTQQPKTESPSNHQSKSKKSPCLCGEEHQFRNYPYLIESKRSNDWKADPDVEKKIQDKIRANKKLDGIIKSIQQKQLEGSTDTGNSRDPPALFATTTSIPYVDQSDYILQDSFILDSGATTHVCNNREQFQDFKPATDEDIFYAGDTIISIEGFGTIEITIQGSTGPKKISLTKAAYIPAFHTNVASLKQFIQKDVHWNTKTGHLIYWDQIFCKVPEQHGQ